ncbi:uncharacterized protein LOC6607988 [Drosophila sechellia]|uniref:Uncharacterized protein n=2 Tax=melanogaster subgroup TaxID=32351 RepID=A0A0J9R7D6_DROSI|nr:uncharacterized protein LOC6607988 [Drosophila sechellia]XP_016026279.1 uncharacterized protein LOC6733360 [Drosophila simulans]EDW46749.1 GM20799 [Drosophila sechellia]KMY91968.1 uncharacterized protein Dsimw501_GD10261 [Drosophila simulans]
MRLFPVYFAIIFLFQYEVCSISDTMKTELRSWFGNIKQLQNPVTLNTLKKLCVVEVMRGSKHRINVGNIDISNKNTLENFIKLPSIKMPNITIVIVEDELSKRARSGSQYKEREMEKLVSHFKECILAKLKALS